ncbi:hypothetical protein BDV97DRAFT_34410 [Delphinella strobiligena]|nr:hypothetical protein BDV97DRAFT_34410 [Delphinella strobiligena]
MRASIPLTLIASISITSATDACSSALASDLACLPSAASSYCTAASYLDTASPSIVTTTVGASESGVTTVTSTVIRTVIVTEGATSTVWSASVLATTASTTITTYVSSVTAAKHAVGTCSPSAAMSSLSALGSGQLWTVCSCMGVVPPASTLATAVTEPVTGELDRTVTTTITGEVDLTVAPSTVILYTVTSSFTQTSTVTLQAPTFTQVWGTKAGCVDPGFQKSDTLDSLNSLDGMTQAISQCQDNCAQLDYCAFVFVQYTLPDYNVTPVWKCYYNNHTLNTATDIECGKSETIWGAADGFNAIGRG